MSGNPAGSSINGDGFRFYRYVDPDTGKETDVLSVTSIRRLCGESFNLVNWQLANLADAALGTMKRTVIGPRGGVSEKRLIEEYPCEFAQRYDAAKGSQTKVDELRKWLREQADEPRGIAAIRGTITHEAIEKNVAWDRIERPYLEAAFAGLSGRDDRKRAAKGVAKEDISFVRNAVRQYWDMRATLPMVIIARECQVFNLTVGYAGTFDALVWLLGTFDVDGEFTPLDIDMAKLPKATDITLATIRQYGGTLVCADWKTAKDVHTDNIVQDTAYLSSEFVTVDGVRDQRLTDLMEAAHHGAIVHIRPNAWGFHVFEYAEEIVNAFLGSCIFARFLARYPKPQALFINSFKGESSETDEGIEDDDE